MISAAINRAYVADLASVQSVLTGYVPALAFLTLIGGALVEDFLASCAWSHSAGIQFGPHVGCFAKRRPDRSRSERADRHLPSWISASRTIHIKWG